jgi:outer membrane receptor for ferrienterochelin and colicin
LSDEFSTNAWSVSAQDRKRVLPYLTLIGGVRYGKENYTHKSYTEPRLGLEWDWSDRTLFTAGWGKHNQYPTGSQWVRVFGNPALDHIRAEHSALGVRHKVDAAWNRKAETYYKKLSNLVISDPQLNYINAASGKAYGLELLVKKEETDKLSGWFVLNLARSQRRNDVTGEAFRFQYDQPVNTTLVGTYKLSETWTFGMKWNYHSGTPYTPILGTSGTYPDGRPVPLYAGVNSGTLPVYHRLDLRVDRNYVFDRWKLNTYFELNNVYQRKNIVGYTYNPSYTSREPVYAFVLPFSFGVQGEF